MINKLIKTPNKADIIQVSKEIKIREYGKLKEPYFVFCGQKIFGGSWAKHIPKDYPDFLDYSFYFGRDLYFIEILKINDVEHVRIYKGVKA